MKSGCNCPYTTICDWAEGQVRRTGFWQLLRVNEQIVGVPPLDIFRYILTKCVFIFYGHYITPNFLKRNLVLKHNSIVIFMSNNLLLISGQ